MKKEAKRCIINYPIKMETQIDFIQIQKDNEEHFKMASKLWVPFICEVNAHDGTHEDEEQIMNGLKKESQFKEAVRICTLRLPL